MLNANPVKAYPEVYMGTLENAMHERNVDAYLDSRKLNIDCKNAIEQAITENFDGMSLNPDTQQVWLKNMERNVLPLFWQIR